MVIFNLNFVNLNLLFINACQHQLQVCQKMICDKMDFLETFVLFSRFKLKRWVFRVLNVTAYNY